MFSPRRAWDRSARAVSPLLTDVGKGFQGNLSTFGGPTSLSRRTGRNTAERRLEQRLKEVPTSNTQVVVVAIERLPIH